MSCLFPQKWRYCFQSGSGSCLWPHPCTKKVFKAVPLVLGRVGATIGGTQGHCWCQEVQEGARLTQGGAHRGPPRSIAPQTHVQLLLHARQALSSIQQIPTSHRALKNDTGTSTQMSTPWFQVIFHNHHNNPDRYALILFSLYRLKNLNPMKLRNEPRVLTLAAPIED